MAETEKKVVFSGIQPSGAITIGNYLGAAKNFPAMQAEYDCFYCIVDMHSITVDLVPAKLRANTYELLALYLSMGIDPDKSAIFAQSHVHEHAELAWILNCNTYFGEAKRMVQFKEKSAKNTDNVNVGLFSYPVLMAADILLYRTALVPVGQDQKQHLELARNLAARFNAKYSDTFVVPEVYTPKHVAKIKSLSDPSAKMSKSDMDENASIFVLDSDDAIARKIRRAVTDSDGRVAYKPEKAGICNLISIYSGFSGLSIKETEKKFGESNYKDFKEAVAEAVIEGLAPIKKNFNQIISDKAYLDGVLKKGAEKASYAARKTLQKVYRKVGFVQI